MSPGETPKEVGAPLRLSPRPNEHHHGGGPQETAGEPHDKFNTGSSLLTSDCPSPGGPGTGSKTGRARQLRPRLTGRQPWVRRGRAMSGDEVLEPLWRVRLGSHSSRGRAVRRCALRSAEGKAHVCAESAGPSVVGLAAVGVLGPAGCFESLSLMQFAGAGPKPGLHSLG